MPASAAVELLHDPQRVRLALSPIKRQLLERLREPSSATRLAAELGTSRQRVNYHLRAGAGPTGGTGRGAATTRLHRTRDGRHRRRVRVVPSVMHTDDISAPAPVQDRHAAKHLIDTAAGVVRDVARMQTNAQRDGRRLLTFTIEAEVGLAAPAISTLAEVERRRRTWWREHFAEPGSTKHAADLRPGSDGSGE